jgi:hypothetical protein
MQHDSTTYRQAVKAAPDSADDLRRRAENGKQLHSAFHNYLR